MMARTGTVPTRVALAAALIVGVFAAALWWPAVHTPFWGDDYFFLEEAFKARHAGESWWAPFWPDTVYQFWRPLGHETYWRFVESVLGGDPRLAHGVNFILWGLACLCVGAFAAVLARALQWQRPAVVGAMATAIYSVLALHFTPLHWTSSADSFFIVIGSALALAAWTGLAVCRPAARIALCAALPLLQVLALFSKESAVVVPLLMVCVSLLVRTWKPKAMEVAAWAACAILVVAWLFVRQRFVLAPPAEYAPRLGFNVLRNAASLMAWLLNVPREALRMFMVGPRSDAWIWIMAAALPMGAFLLGAASVLRGQMTMPRIAAVLAFVAIAYAPYALLNWQSYEYYAQVAAILPAALVAHAAAISMRATLMLALLCVSSAVAVEGSRTVGYPALIARAYIAEEQINALVYRELLEPAVDDDPLAVEVANAHQFYALGRAGLTWRLGRAPLDVAVAEGCTGGRSRVLEIRDGELRLRDCVTEASLDF